MSYGLHVDADPQGLDVRRRRAEGDDPGTAAYRACSRTDGGQPVVLERGIRAIILHMAKRRPPRPTDSEATENPIATHAAMLGYGLLFAATLTAYWPAMQGSLLWDDTRHVTSAELQSFHGLWRIWFNLGATQQYYPLLHSA